MILRKKFQGIAILVFASALYGLYGIYARMIATSFGVFTQNWIRNVFVVLLTLIILFLSRKKFVTIAKTDIPWIASWVICDIIFVILLFISFNNLSIGTTLFLMYSGITIAGYITGSLLLKEQLTRTKYLAIALSLIGLLLIFGNQLEDTESIYAALAILAGLVGGIWFVLPKMISTKYPRLQLVALDGAGILVVNLILALYFSEPIPDIAWSLAWLGIGLYGITQIFADILIIRGFRLVEAHIGSLILPLEAVFGVLFGFIFFAEVLPSSVIVGGIFIMLGALLPNIKVDTWRKLNFLKIS